MILNSSFNISLQDTIGGVKTFLLPPPTPSPQEIKKKLLLSVKLGTQISLQNCLYF